MTKTRFGAALVVGLFACTPAFASSTVTDLFLANVKANVAFLDQSGKLASSHSKSPAVRSFAKAEIGEAFRTAEMLNGVAPPVQVAEVSPDRDVVITGRSAATVPPLGEAANGRTALGQSDVAKLAGLKGRPFDDALWLKQVDALSQLRADYETYAASGDDEVLRAVAKRELPKIEARLAALSNI